MLTDKENEYVDFIINLERLILKYGASNLKACLDMQLYTGFQEFVVYLEESREELAKTSYSNLKEKIFLRNVVRAFDDRHNLEGEFCEWLY